MAPSVPVQYSHLTGPLVGAKREKFDVYWFIGPLCILRQVLNFDLTNKMLMHVNKNAVQVTLRKPNNPKTLRHDALTPSLFLIS